MQRFKNVLVIYGDRVGDDASLARATALAKANRARLTIAEVVQDRSGDSRNMLLPPSREEKALWQGYLKERRAHLERLASAVRHDGVRAKTLLLQGTPFLEIIRAVVRHEFDLVISTPEPRRGIRRLFFGSTSMHLIRKCPCPVWILHPRQKPRFRRILAAVDPDPNREEPDPLDIKIMDLASSLARTESCQLQVFHAWEYVGADLDTSRSEISPKIRRGLEGKYRKMHRFSLQRLLSRYDLGAIDHKVSLRKGRPANLIPAFAEHQNVDLIVMGTVTRTGIAGYFIGSTAEDVLQQVSCSVLAVKPDGFVTPVQIDRQTEHA